MFSLTPLYRGGSNEIAGWLHKFTGLGVFLFLALHILDTAALAYSTELYNKIIGFYRRPLFKVGEVLLVGCVLFHAFNGVRLIILDIFTSLIPKHRTLIWIETALVFALWLPTGYMIFCGH